MALQRPPAHDVATEVRMETRPTQKYPVPTVTQHLARLAELNQAFSATIAARRRSRFVENRLLAAGVVGLALAFVLIVQISPRCDADDTLRGFASL